MAGIKIVDLPAVGRDLAATDLFEMSLAGGTGSRKITGQEIMNASKLSVNNTPVINGTSGRIFFQDAANVLQQSANLFWDNTNGRLGIGTSSPASSIHIATNNASVFTQGTFGSSSSTGVILRFQNQDNTLQSFIFSTGTSYTSGTYQSGQLNMGSGASGGVAIRTSNAANAHIRFYSGNADPDLSPEIARFVSNTGNLLINTTTDAGYKLDVNGTARVLGNVDFGNTSSVASLLTVSIPFSVSAATDLLRLRGVASKISIVFGAGGVQSASLGSLNLGNSYFESGLFFNTASGGVVYEAMRIANTRNILINTTTDDGFKLDVNGTARVQGNTTVALNQNAATQINISNTTSGSSASPILNLTSDVASGIFQFGKQSTLTNVYKIIAAKDGFIYNSTTGGDIAILNDFATGRIKFAAGGASTAQMTLFSTGNIGINTTTDAGFRLDVNGDTIFRRITNVTPNTITGGTQFFTVKSGNWPTALIRCFENGVITLGSSSGSIGFDTSIFNLPVSSTFNFNYVPLNQLNTFAFILSANYTNVGAGGTSEGTMLRTSGSTSTSVGAVTMNQIESKPTYNNTGGTTINRGFYYNPILTSMTNTTHYAIHSTSGRVRLEGLPTSPTGLSAGDLYNDGGTIKIV